MDNCCCCEIGLFHPKNKCAMTVHHGSQELGSGVVNLMEDYNCCISIPLHKITEPPSYTAWMDADKFIHKRELCKSGEWCQYCWGPAHEKGFKCVYYNFCRKTQTTNMLRELLRKFLTKTCFFEGFLRLFGS